jgi:hypothetical protein
MTAILYILAAVGVLAIAYAVFIVVDAFRHPPMG